MLEEGEVGAGDAIEPIRQATPRMSISAMMHLLYFDPGNLAATRTALEIDALSPGWRQSFTDRIEQASGG